jgi:hypothetical protein
MVSIGRTRNSGAAMTFIESKALKSGARVYWQGKIADSGIISETSWDAVTIAWDNGQVTRVHHGDMREIYRAPTSQTMPTQFRSP